MSTYTIQYGDTLSGIAKKYNTDVNTLMGLNPYITNANKIYAGKSLTLPTAQPTTNTVQATAPVQQSTSTQKTTVPTKSTQELAEEYAKQQTANTGSDTQALLAQYEKIAEQQKQTLQQQQQLTNSQITSQKDEIMKTYNDNARQAYINSMLGKKSVQQELSQAGLNTSGLLGSAYANVENAYGNNLANLQNARDTSINDMNQQLNEAQLQYAIKESELLADIENAKLELQKYGNELAYQKYQDALNNYMNFANYDYTKATDERNYNYQVSRDQVADSQWQQAFDYQKQQDALAQENWLKEYNLALKKSSSSGSSSSTKSYNLNSSNNSQGINNTPSQQYTAQDILSNAKIMQGANANGTGVTTVKDGISGKTFSSVTELLKYYDV